MKAQELIEFENEAGDDIQEWIQNSMTIENGCKRSPDEDDFYSFEMELSWMFTQKGEKLYRSYLSKIHHLRKLKFPTMNEKYNEIVTGVIYP